VIILVVLAVPPQPSARAQAAAALGLALADINQRLAGTLPRVLLVESAPSRIPGHVAALVSLGWQVVTLDPALVADDSQRTVARRIELHDDALVALDAQGTAHRCPLGTIALMQKGLRREQTHREVKVSERHLDVKKALLTGGLLLTKKVERTDVKTTTIEEAFILVERNDGEPDIMFYEKRLDYRGLGPSMNASSRVNFEDLWRRLRALIPRAPADERTLRPGFVAGLPHTAADPLDLALALVSLAYRQGGASPGGVAWG
jgi:hypothetical protein